MVVLMSQNEFEFKSERGICDDRNAAEGFLLMMMMMMMQSVSWREVEYGTGPVWPDKNRQMSIEVPKNFFTRKMNDFDTFTKIALELGRLGQINCCQML